MRKKTRKQSSQQFDKFASILSLAIFVMAWYLGGLRIENNQQEMLKYSLVNAEQLVPVKDGLYKGTMPEADEAVEWIGQGTGIGYGGETKVGLTLSPDGDISQVTILSSQETQSYLDKVVQHKFPQQLLGKNIREPLVVDGITGATYTSGAVLQAANKAAEPMREQLYGLMPAETASPVDSIQLMDVVSVVLFALAVWASRTQHPQKKNMNVALLVVSFASLGLYSASLYSSATMGILASGAWLSGLGNYTALILLVLSVVYILMYNRNIYCQSLCPFGATQRCLAKVTNAKPATFKHGFFVWFPRILLLATLSLGVYFRSPATFSYEPFGIMFGMIGSMYLFVLTVLVLLTSLAVRRPWCQTLCPVNAMTDYLKFNKMWLKQSWNKSKKSKKRKLARQQGGTA